MKSVNMKYLKISLALGLALTIFMSVARFDTLCNDLRTNVLRMHILANSNSDDDQALKLKVRDAVIEKYSCIFDKCNSLNEAISVAENNIDEMSITAQSVITESGYDYPVKAVVCKSYFDTREYEKFTLPAGEYEAVRIEIGKAEGKNWWCVMFPSVCVYSASNQKENKNNGQLSDSASKDSAYMAEHSERYVMKFKIIEVYEKIKKYFTKN